MPHEVFALVSWHASLVMMTTAQSAIRLYILAGDIAYNKGDRGNLMSQIALIRSRYPDSDITLCSMEPERDAKWYDARVIKRSFWLNRRQWKYMKSADVIIWGGGAPVTDHGCILLIPYWMSILFFVRFVLRKPIMAWSHGTVITTLLGRFLARILYGWTNRIAVRDESSFALVQSLNRRLKPVLTADVAVLMQYDKSPDPKTQSVLDWMNSQGNVIGIHPTFWHLYNHSKYILPYMLRKKIGIFSYPDHALLQEYKRGICALIDSLIDRFDCSILLLPRYPHPDWEDNKHLNDVARCCQLPERVKLLSDDVYPPAQYPIIIERLDFSITVALHEAIFAMVTHTPFIHLCYESKGADFMRQLNATDRLGSWRLLLSNDGRGKVMEMVEQTTQDWNDIHARQTVRSEALQKAASANLDLLSGMPGIQTQQADQ